MNGLFVGRTARSAVARPVDLLFAAKNQRRDRAEVDRPFPPCGGAGETGDSGARFLLGKHVEVVAEVEMADDAVLRDFDTTESLATLPARLRPDFVPEGTAR